MLTLQEAFNKIYIHAQKKEKSVNSKNPFKCLYRGPNGSRCFIGVLIPDDKCSENIESLLYFDEVLRLCDVNENLFFFYRRLQQIHDLNHPREWNNLLHKFAEKYKLTIPQL